MFDTLPMQTNGIAALGTLSIGVIAIAPSDPNIVYIGTGEQLTGYFGNGLYRIENATQANPTLVGPINPNADYGFGFTTSTFTFRAISQIQSIQPHQGRSLFRRLLEAAGSFPITAPVRPSVFPPLGVMGLYRSTNATAAADAVTFTKLTVAEAAFPTGNTDISDMVLDPSDATANTLIVWARTGGGVATGARLIARAFIAQPTPRARARLPSS